MSSSETVFPVSKNHSSKTASNLIAYQKNQITFSQLHHYSVTQSECFWRDVLTVSDIPFSGSADTVNVEGAFFGADQWFPHVQLNYAEYCLRKSWRSTQSNGLALHERSCGLFLFINISRLILSRIRLCAAFD